MAFDLTYLGHSAFEIMSANGESVLIDPYLSMCPDYDWRSKNITDIFVTHGHSDHLGSAIKISKETGAKINAIFELAGYCAEKGATVSPFGLGGWVDLGWSKVIFLPALHSSSTPEGNYAGCPCSILFEIEGIKLFHAGDTCLTQEFKIIHDMNKPDIALLPIGGRYTMDEKSASIAAQWIGADVIIPMHYNTFPQIEADVQKFKMMIEDLNKQCLIMDIKGVACF